MVRPKTAVAKGPSLDAVNKSKNQRLSSAERSAYFARREAAKVLRSILQGDDQRRALGSIKTLVYNPSVRNKKATFALEISLVGDAEKFLTLRKEAIQSALARLLVRRKAKRIEDLVTLYQTPGCDLHAHSLVTNGSVFLQGKVSSMVAAALAPEPGWKVLDACSAPGNKTVHLAALMKGKEKL